MKEISRLLTLMTVVILGIIVFRFFFFMALYRDGRPVQSNMFVKVLISPFVPR
ncbi:MAG TPA: hypothetical protein VGE62_01920 [Candidatus Paceibacterota bacterium]